MCFKILCMCIHTNCICTEKTIEKKHSYWWEYHLCFVRKIHKQVHKCMCVHVYLLYIHTKKHLFQHMYCIQYMHCIYTCIVYTPTQICVYTVFVYIYIVNKRALKTKRACMTEMADH